MATVIIPGLPAGWLERYPRLEVRVTLYGPRRALDLYGPDAMRASDDLDAAGSDWAWDSSKAHKDAEGRSFLRYLHCPGKAARYAEVRALADSSVGPDFPDYIVDFQRSGAGKE